MPIPKIKQVKLTPKYHDAETGKFVSPDYAKTHPKTTFKESGPHPRPKKVSKN